MIGALLYLARRRRPRIDPAVMRDVIRPAIASGVASEIMALTLARGASEATARRRAQRAARRTLRHDHKVSGLELRCVQAALKAAPDRPAMVEAATACAGEPLDRMVNARRQFWTALCESLCQSLCQSTTGGDA